MRREVGSKALRYRGRVPSIDSPAEDARSERPTRLSQQRPAALTALTLLLWAQAAAAAAAGLLGGWAAVNAPGETDPLVYGLVAMSLAIAAAFAAFGRAAARARTWMRGPVITIEIILIAATLSSISDLHPALTVGILGSSVAALALLFAPPVVVLTVSERRRRGAFSEDE